MSRYPSEEVARFDQQFAETQDERNARLRAKRLARLTEADNKSPIFRDHSCWRCNDGAKPCVRGGPHRCEYPHARND